MQKLRLISNASVRASCHPRKRVLQFCLLLAACVLPACSPPQDDENDTRDIVIQPEAVSQGGKSLAIIVAVQDYASLPKLKYCRADGQLYEDVLKDVCGFDTVVVLAEDAEDPLYKPSLGNLSNQIRNWLKVANNGEYRRVLFCFCGHAFRDAKGRLYLAPPDCDRQNLELTGLPQSYVKQMLDGCTRVPVKLCILDCCHAGEGRGGGVGVSGSDLAEVFKSAKGLLTLASCRNEELSLEWKEKQHGLFTYWLCQGLQGPADEMGNHDGVIDHQELYAYVSKQVLETAAELGRLQTPVLLPSADWSGIAAIAEIAGEKALLDDTYLPEDLSNSSLATSSDDVTPEVLDSNSTLPKEPASDIPNPPVPEPINKPEIPSRAPTAIGRAIIRDLKGSEEELTDVTLTHEHVSTPVIGHFEIILEDSPMKVTWVHFARIKKATFEQDNDDTRITVLLDDETIITGKLPELKLSGNMKALGNVSYGVDKLASIEFLSYCARINGETAVIDRETASLAWKKEREGEKSEQSWTIIGSDVINKAEGLSLIDRYHRSWFGMAGRHSERDAHNFINRIRIEKGSAEAELSLKDYSAIEFTGIKTDGKSEAVVHTPDGESSTVVAILKTTSHSSYRPGSASTNSEEYGAFNEDDFLIWNSQYGYDGVSLVPARKLILTRGTEDIEPLEPEPDSTTIIDEDDNQITLSEVTSKVIDVKVGKFDVSIPVSEISSVRSCDNDDIHITMMNGRKYQGTTGFGTKIEGEASLGSYSIPLSKVKSVKFALAKNEIIPGESKKEGFYVTCVDTEGISFSFQPFQFNFSVYYFGGGGGSYSRFYLPMRLNGCAIRLPFADIENASIEPPRTNTGSYHAGSVVVKLRDGRVVTGELSSGTGLRGDFIGHTALGNASIDLYEVNRLSFSLEESQDFTTEPMTKMDIYQTVKFNSGYTIKLKTRDGKEAVLEHAGAITLTDSCMWKELKPELTITIGVSQVAVDFDKIIQINFDSVAQWWQSSAYKPRTGTLMTAAGKEEDVTCDGKAWVGGILKGYGPARIQIGDIASIEIHKVEQASTDEP